MSPTIDSSASSRVARRTSTSASHSRVPTAGRDATELADLAEQLELDAPALRDAVEDVDLPKVDDFGAFMVVVLRALGDEWGETYELDCFLSARRLIPIRVGHRNAASRRT